MDGAGHPGPPSGARLDAPAPDAGAQFDLLRAVAPLVADSPIPSETTVLDHLADGLPVLRANIGPLPVDVLTPVMADLGAAITGATGYVAARRVADALTSGTVDAARLLALVYQRDQDGVRQLATDHTLVVDMLWLLGDLVVAPIVHLQQRAALRDGEPDSPVREALERWTQGYCPACGSWPALAEFFFGERLLRCAFCACTWRPAVDRCTYCNEKGEHFTTVVPDRQQPGPAYRALPRLRRLPQDHGCRAGHAFSATRHRRPGQRRPGSGGVASWVHAVAAQKALRTGFAGSRVHRFTGSPSAASFSADACSMSLCRLLP
jgi:hypothetical protein